ncbi:MAG TPA: hypothetical protein VMP01_12150 [Pirellulaceae bacterium]|nr:hypothetical protein [Pirellulaceae bacterium]
MLRFTIRDLLWLTLLAAVLVAWWVDRGRLNKGISRLQDPYLQPFGRSSWIRDIALPKRAAPAKNLRSE